MATSTSSSARGFENALEQRTPTDLAVYGTIPPWLSGVLYRTGPGTYRIPTVADSDKFVDIHHWFDGLALHHRFEISHDNGTPRVAYRSRKGAADLETQIAKEERWPIISFGQKADPCQSIFRKFFTIFTATRAMRAPTKSGINAQITLTPDMPGIGTDNATATLPDGPQYIVAATDANILQILDPDTLEPIQATNYSRVDPRLEGQLTAAHGCYDRQTGEFYNYLCKFGGRFPTYQIFKIRRDGQSDILATICDAPAAYLHSFGMTEKYVILCVWQAHITGLGLPILWNLNVMQSIKKEWDNTQDTIFYVVDRHKGGLIAKYKTPPFFCFHQLNAYDDSTSSDIIMDMSVYPTHNILDLLYLSKLRDVNDSFHMGCARRFRLPSPLSINSATTRNALIEFDLPETLCIELPTIHPALYHRPYRYAYGITTQREGIRRSVADGVIKLDMESPNDTEEGTHKVWRRAGFTPSEPVFVPRPHTTPGNEEDKNGEGAEDDGVLLTVVLNEERGLSALVVLDAQTMEEIGRAEMNHVFPIGFHGVWTERH